MSFLFAFSILIILVILIRAVVDGKISRRVQYAMWIILPIFLVGFYAVSLNAKVVKSESLYEPKSYVNEYYSYLHKDEKLTSDTRVAESDVAKVSGDDGASLQTTKASEKQNASTATKTQKKFVISRNLVNHIWIYGALVVAAFIAIKNLIFAINLHKSRMFYAISPYGNLKVYKLDKIRSPFIFGKSIYIPAYLNEDSLKYKYSVCHEYSHYANGDSIWQLIKYAFIAAFWFHPLVWIVALLAQRDSEMAADERVISILGEEKKSEYGETLISFIKVMSSDDSGMTIATHLFGHNYNFLKTRLINIMMGGRKSVALTIVTSVLLSIVAGSFIIGSRKVNGATIVDKDSTWFDYEVVSVGADQYEKYGTNDLYMNAVYADRDCFFILVTAVNSYQGMPNKIACYSVDGNCLGEISYPYSEMYIDVVRVEDYFMLLFSNIETNKYYIGIADLSNGELVDKREIAIGSEYTIGQVYEMKYFDNKLYIEFDKQAARMNHQGLMVTDLEGNVITEVELEYDTISWSVNDEGDIAARGSLDKNNENVEIFIFDDMTGDITYYENTNSLKSYNYSNYFYKNNIICLDYWGSITKYDFVNDETETVLDVNCWYGGELIINGSRLFYFDDDCLVLVDDCSLYYPTFYIVRKADVNPNEGKIILRAALINGINIYGSAFEAIREFNINDGEYYIEFDNTYNYVIVGYGESDSNTMQMKIAAEKKLIDDINNGNGPDILINMGDVDYYFADEIAMDLCGLMNNDVSFDKSQYYTNILDAAMVDSKLYYFPLSYNIKGLFVNPDSVSGDVDGFSYDQYSTYIDEYGQFRYSLLLDSKGIFRESFLNDISNYIDDNGYLNIDNNDFRKMVSLVNKISEETTMNQDSMYVDISYSYIENGSSDNSLVGFPNRYGHGISIDVLDSIAISKNTNFVDGAWRFVKTTISDDIQKRNTVGFPINQNVFYENFMSVLNEYKDMAYYCGWDELLFSVDDIHIVESWILSSDYVEKHNYIIEEIVVEEMNYYFDGVRNLDDTIDIIMTRVNSG
ncbi:MAG: extracellular solute-binding protein [Saccharofermentans sp.]|nr:extracellular solute-binding protein [Saccharofermentans sp.]